MNYSDTWFAKHPISISASGMYFRKNHWLHQCVKVFTGKLVPMHEKNPDGSISVLGAEELILTPCFIHGSRNLVGLQESLYKHAEKLKAEGATIITQSKNKLVARNGRETAFFVINTSKKSQPW